MEGDGGWEASVDEEGGLSWMGILFLKMVTLSVFCSRYYFITPLMPCDVLQRASVPKQESHHRHYLNSVLSRAPDA